MVSCVRSVQILETTNRMVLHLGCRLLSKIPARNVVTAADATLGLEAFFLSRWALS
jgi:hypothetical protein